jgi:hypothetical protein
MYMDEFNAGAQEKHRVRGLPGGAPCSRRNSADTERMHATAELYMHD